MKNTTNRAETAAEAKDKQALKHRPIRSFVRHHGRLTSGQQHALDNYWHEFGIDYTGKPLDLSLFGHFDRVVLEIGFGNGETLVEMAKQAPNTLFIGAEVHKPGVGRALMLAKENGLNNLRVIEHDAVEFIDTMLPEHCIDRVQIFFPDPWHKKRHFKRRLIQPAFCRKLQRIMKAKGILHVATDWLPYAEHCVEVIDGLDYFKNVSPTNDYIDKPDYRPETKFERRGLKLGHEVRDMHFVVSIE
ncbi:MAG: tRNA (guanosine(46)-N7)-methyltransferase TrmB [Gammaproteobacteria bacterium]|nr:MAG: tRNA (guanosine(46)-N7)-methyltransferase TrmB [Gammaproteobacteria bacterium]